MLSVLAVAFATQQSEPNLQAWQATLRRVARVERASLCVDVDGSVKPLPVVYEKPEGMRGLDRLAVATARTIARVDGVYVLRRKMEEGDPRLQTPHQHAIDFLTSLGSIDMAKLRDGKLEFANLPPAMQRKLRYSIACFGNGLGDSLLANYPDRIGMRLLLDPVARASSRTGDGFVTLSLLAEKPDVPLPDAVRTTPASPLGRPEDGQIDFEDGAVFTFAEVVQRLERTFGKRYWYDERLAGSHVFVSGSFTEDRLRKVLDLVSEPSPITVMPDGFRSPNFDLERRQIINAAFGSLGNEHIGIGDLTYNSLIVGLSTSFKEIYGSRLPRHVQRFMSDYRIQPEDEVSVSGELYLAFAAPGLAILDSGTLDTLGNPIPYSLPHYIKLGF